VAKKIGTTFSRKFKKFDSVCREQQPESPRPLALGLSGPLQLVYVPSLSFGYFHLARWVRENVIERA